MAPLYVALGQSVLFLLDDSVWYSAKRYARGCDWFTVMSFFFSRHELTPKCSFGAPPVTNVS